MRLLCHPSLIIVVVVVVVVDLVVLVVVVFVVVSVVGQLEVFPTSKITIFIV